MAKVQPKGMLMQNILTIFLLMLSIVLYGDPIAKLPAPAKRSSGRVATLTNWPKIIDFSGTGSFAIGSQVTQEV